VTTWSAHYLPDPGFRRAVADFVERERLSVEQEQEYLGEMMPFKRSG
jgi:predicted N-acyltransferase